ncbi:putative mfs multidrug transporter [Phaeomoniella chlamydospora]|uniref:Putative mfs multidrug transporter n=1 Tax=Phaeomoniella chlamydospora TaxID=158046 RepID=A0A0G2E043_PHACM|nr:putative mfs multidrug transporter [Phaeomoniella chlamydospora]
MYLAYKYIKKTKQEKAAKLAEAENRSAASKVIPVPQEGAKPSSSESEPTVETLGDHDQRPRSDIGTASGITNEPHGEDEECSQCGLCKQKKEKRRIYRWKLIIGLMPPFLLASLDVTVVASSLSFIASHFDRLDQLGWIVTAYTLTSTTFVPAFGQLADVYGRHVSLQFTMALMVIGSTLCAAAQTWGMLLFGRALQGMSAAGIMSISSIVLADKVSLKENAKNNTIFQFIAGTSYSYGPVIGGYLTNANWRYCFVISIPIAIFAHILIFVLLRNELLPGKNTGSRKSFFAGLATIDAGGTVLFILGIGLIILGTAWGGATYAWSSAAVLVPIVVGGILFMAFFIYEYLLEPGRYLNRLLPRQNAMIPFSLFIRKDLYLVAAIQFATGAALYSIFYFIGIYFTLVENYDAGEAGVQLLYYIPGIAVGVYSAMFMSNIYPGSTFISIFLGTLIETAGIGLIVHAVEARNIAFVNGMMGLAGVGTGLRFMPAVLHVAGIWPTRLAPALSLMRFALPFGGTLALTIMSSVFNNQLNDLDIDSGDLRAGTSSASTSSLSAIAKLPPAMQRLVRNKAKSGVKWAFVSILPILFLSVIASLFLGNVWIKQRGGKKTEEKKKNGMQQQSTAIQKQQQQQSADLKPEIDEEKIVEVKSEDPRTPATNTSYVLYECYLLALFRGKQYLDSKKQVSQPITEVESSMTETEKKVAMV